MTRRQILLTVQAVVTLVLLVLLFRRFDWTAFASLLRAMSPSFYAASLLAVVGGQLLYALRWQAVLQGMGTRVRYADVLSQFLIGIFFSNIMPTAIGGDAAKVFYLGRLAGYVEVGASVFVDRFLGFLWLSIAGAALAWVVGGDSALFVLNRNLLTLFAVGFSTILAVAWIAPLDRLLEDGRWPGRAAPLIARVRGFAILVRDGACRPATLVVSAAVTLSYAFLLALVYVRYFQESGVPPIGILPVANIVIGMAIFINVPISVNGIGLREQLHSLLFATLGVPKEVAVSLALLLFSHFLLLSLAGCALWFRIK